MSNQFLEGSYCHDMEQRIITIQERLSYRAAYLDDVATNANESNGAFGLLNLTAMNALNSRANDHAQRINSQGNAINSIKDVLVGSGIMEDELP